MNKRCDCCGRVLSSSEVQCERCGMPVAGTGSFSISKRDAYRLVKYSYKCRVSYIVLAVMSVIGVSLFALAFIDAVLSGSVNMFLGTSSIVIFGFAWVIGRMSDKYVMSIAEVYKKYERFEEV